VTGYFDWEVKLQQLATEQTRARGKRVTLQDLNAEMINDCFAKDGKPEIASVNRKEGQG
jgi:hypothetical protein